MEERECNNIFQNEQHQFLCERARLVRQVRVAMNGILTSCPYVSHNGVNREKTIPSVRGGKCKLYKVATGLTVAECPYLHGNAFLP